MHDRTRDVVVVLRMELLLAIVRRSGKGNGVAGDRQAHGNCQMHQIGMDGLHERLFGKLSREPRCELQEFGNDRSKKQLGEAGRCQSTEERLANPWDDDGEENGEAQQQ